MLLHSRLSPAVVIIHHVRLGMESTDRRLLRVTQNWTEQQVQAELNWMFNMQETKWRPRKYDKRMSGRGCGETDVERNETAAQPLCSVKWLITHHYERMYLIKVHIL